MSTWRDMETVDTRTGWSDWRVLTTTKKSQLAVMVIQPGDHEGGPKNEHADSDQWMLVVAGHGEARVEGKTITLSPGKLLLIEAGEKHEIQATGDAALVTWNLYAPPAY